MKQVIVLLFLLFSISCNTVDTNNQLKKETNKIVIAHRGASGYLPEHTMEAKAMAYAMDAITLSKTWFCLKIMFQ